MKEKPLTNDGSVLLTPEMERFLRRGFNGAAITCDPYDQGMVDKMVKRGYLRCRRALGINYYYITQSGRNAMHNVTRGRRYL